MALLLHFVLAGRLFDRVATPARGQNNSHLAPIDQRFVLRGGRWVVVVAVVVFPAAECRKLADFCLVSSVSYVYNPDFGAELDEGRV